MLFTFKGLSNTKLDSLLSELRTNENEIEKINILNSLGDYYVEVDLAKSELYYQQGLQNSNQLLLESNERVNELKISKSNILCGLGYVDYLRFNYRNAIIQLEKSNTIKQSVYGNYFEDKKLLQLYLGYCYHKLGDYKTALDYFQLGLSETENSTDVDFLAELNLALGSSYKKIIMYSKAIQHYKEVIKIARKNRLSELQVRANNGLVEIYQETKKWNKSNKLLLQSKELIKYSSDKGKVMFYAHLGNQLNHQNHSDSARAYFQLSIAESERLYPIQGTDYIYRCYAEFEIEQGHFEKAKIYVSKLILLGIRTKDLHIQANAFGLDATISEKTSQYSRAYFCMKKQKKLLETLAVEDSKIKVLKQELLLNAKQRELKDSLRFDALLQKRESKLETQSILIEEEKKVKYSLFVGLVFAVIALIVFFFGLRRKKRDNKIITAQKEKSEVHQTLLSAQNESLQTKASLYKILNVSSKDLSIKNVLSEVLDHIVNLSFIGAYGKGFVYLNNEGRLNGVDIRKGVSHTEVNEYKRIKENECIADKEHFGFEAEFCNIKDEHYYVPIVNNNEILGVLVIFTKGVLIQNEKSVDFLNVVSKLLGETVSRHNMTDKLRLAHIENTLKKKQVKKAHDKVNQSLMVQAAINDLIGAIIKNENIGERVFNYITGIFKHAFIRRLNITLFDFDKEEVSFYFLRENGEDKLENKPFSLNSFSEETLSGLKKNERIIVNSIKDKAHKSESDLQMLKNNIDSFICFPLMADKVLLGSLNVSFEDELTISKDQEEFVTMLVEGITIAINQKVMFNQIVSSNSELYTLHNELNSSINYAQKIQEAILPTDELFTKIFPNHFKILKQKDKVGGDFYWVREYKDGTKLLICIDCTGHNVPGAFMTMLARVLVRESATIKGIRNPSDILEQMDGAVRRILKQNSYDGMQDGMDVTICVLNESNNSIKFASAQRPIIYVEKGKDEITLIKGCKYSVGGYSEEKKIYKITELPLDTVDKIYMTTDGYLDQFGGPNIKKIGKRNFVKSLNLIHKLPMVKQKEFLLNELNNWQGSLDQIDDICVIGVDLT